MLMSILKTIKNLLRKILSQPGFELGIFKMLINIVSINLMINLFMTLILIQV